MERVGGGGRRKSGDEVNSAFMQEILNRRRKLKDNILLEGTADST